MEQVKYHYRLLAISTFTVFLDLMGFGILIPIQPFIALSFGASPALVTLLGASFSLMQFLFVPFWGYVSDRIGRKPVMLLGIAFSTLGYALFGLAESLEVLFLARMLSGFGGANIGTAQAIIADSTSKEERAKGMGLIGFAFGFGFIFGPILSGFFSKFSLSTPAFVASALSLLNLVCALFFLPETCWKTLSKSHNYPSLGITKAFKIAQMFHNIPQLLLLSLFVVLSFSMLEQSLGLFIQASWSPCAHNVIGLGPQLAKEVMKKSVNLTTYFLITFGISAAIFQGFFVGKLVNLFGERKLIIFGVTVLTAGLFILPIIGSLPSFGPMILLAIGLALGTGTTFPAIASYLSKLAPPQDQGLILGLGQSLSALGRVIGPSLAGLFFEFNIGAPFFIGAIIMFFCIILAGKIKQSAD